MEKSEKEEKDVFDRAFEELWIRRDRVLNNEINCIPLSFPRLRAWFPGIEKRRYTILTASQKVGKSKLADYMYVYEPFFYMLEHPEQLRLKILYFTLEMGKKEKFYEFLCHLLYRLDGIRISPTKLKSTSAEDPVPEEILNLLNTPKYQEYIKRFKDTVTFIDDERNPTGINKYCRSFALKRGKFHFKKIQIRNEEGILEDREIIDYYEPNDPDEYVIVILDNYSNLMPESGMNKMQTIEKMSKYFITQRDQFDFCIVGIQHQAQSQEGIENQKLNKLMPTSDGLADAKTTSRDINALFGLFNPFKYGIKEYEGYDITKFRNNIRFLQILEDRDNGAGGQICPLFFDGAIGYFTELPLPQQTGELSKVISYIGQLGKQKTNPVLFLSSRGRIKKKRVKIKELIKGKLLGKKWQMQS